ncbi:unnamed protein product [Mytilus edulis]|uniref:Aspartic peptidase DDI1-type domain-containing protein n=1 Tax=Mytilus edulis TaxID=6550 RepID=A0A8S3TK78_MYTED|nr:unnamed protein product [Mytilus edulis]
MQFNQDQTKATMKLDRNKKVTINSCKGYVYVHLENMPNQESISLGADEMEQLMEVFTRNFADTKKVIQNKISTQKPPQQEVATSPKSTNKITKRTRKLTNVKNNPFVLSEAVESRHKTIEREEEVGHVNQYALIDSGSDINVINEQVIKTVNCRKYRSDKTRITAVNNEHMSISSVVYIPITIGNDIFSIKFYVVQSIKPDIILGLEFLQANNIIIDFNNNKIRVDPRRQLILSKDTVIPPMSEKVVVARIRGSYLPDEIIGLTSASPKLLSSGLMTAKSISKVDKNQILFGVGNFTDKPITLSKQCNLGKFVCLSKHDKLYDFEYKD